LNKKKGDKEARQQPLTELKAAVAESAGITYQRVVIS
jgi:protein tyrosine phosphatase (PTP) superfamily phosphohydrolase (DUF442 family)